VEGAECLVRCGGLLTVVAAAIGDSDRQLCYMQTEYMKRFERAVGECCYDAKEQPAIYHKILRIRILHA
jgi:hypothetical protein